MPESDGVNRRKSSWEKSKQRTRDKLMKMFELKSVSL